MAAGGPFGVWLQEPGAPALIHPAQSIPTSSSARLRPDELGRIADQTGMSVDDVRELLAAGLPEVVSHLTPDGTVPDDAAVGAMIQKLSRFL